MPLKTYNYQNFDIDVNGDTMLIIIWGLYIGIMAGVLGSIICRVYSGRIVQALIKAGAVDDSTSKTLAELGLSKQYMVRRMLRAESSLRRMVMVTEGTGVKESGTGKASRFWHEKFIRDDIPQKLDYTTARFYLPEDKRISAEVRYQKEGHPILSFILAAIGLFIAAYFATVAVPELLQMLDNFLTDVTPVNDSYL